MKDRNEVLEAAQREATERDWEATKQFLANHELKFSPEGNLEEARVDDKTIPGRFFVYYEIVDQPYYFVLIIQRDQSQQMQVIHVRMEPRIGAALEISSATLTNDAITARVGMAPTAVQPIGEGADQARPSGTPGEHTWTFEPQRGTPASVEEKLATLLECTAPVASEVAALRSICDVQVRVVYEGWGGDPQFGGFVLEEADLCRLAALGADFVLEVHALGPEMVED